MIISILLLSHTTHFANSLMVDPNKATLFSLYFYTFNGINFVAGMVGLYGIFNRNLVALKAVSLRSVKIRYKLDCSD